MKFAYQWHRRVGWVVAPLLALSACSGAVLLWTQPLPVSRAAPPAVRDWSRSLDAGMKELARLFPAAEADMVDFPRTADAPIRVHLRGLEPGGSGWAPIDLARNSVGALQPDSRDARETLLGLHEHLLLGDAGDWVLRAVAFGALVLIGMGLRIWWRLRRLPARSVWRRWHRWVGPLAALPIAMMLVTGLVLRSPELARAALPGEAVAPKLEATPRAGGPWASFGDALFAASAALPQAQPTRLYAARDGVVRVRLREDEWNPFGLHYVHLRAADASVLRVVRASEQPLSVRYLDVVYPLHAAWLPGNAGLMAGLAMRVAWSLIALALAAMAVSGAMQRFNTR